MMKMNKKVCNSKIRNSVVLLGRLPMWISEQKSVQVFIKSRELVITSLPSSPTWHEFRSMNNFCRNNLLEFSNQDMKDGKRLTRSTGGTVVVDFNAKLPDDRNHRCKILGACGYPFLGFESCHHAIYLSNNEVFQFLSKVEDKMDFVLSMVITDIDCSEEELRRSVSLTNECKSLTSGSRNDILKYKKPLSKKKVRQRHVSSKGYPGQVAFQSNEDNRCATDNGPLNGVNAWCGKDFCRLGCMCDSLKSKRKRTHCGHADCMFSRKCIGPSSTQNDSSRLTLLSQEANSPENEGMSVKRQRRPPKRWLEEEEELDLIAEVKKKSKLFVHASPPKGNDSGTNDDFSEKVNLPDANVKDLEPESKNSPCTHSESNSLPKRPFHVAIKSTSGRLMHKISILKKSAIGESSMTNDSLKSNIFHGNTSSSLPLPRSSLLNDASKPDASNDYSLQYIIARKYFRNYKEYRKIIMSLEVGKSHLVSMCTSTLSPLRVNSMRLMKWEILAEKVRRNSAYLWLSQPPKCVAKLYVSESETPPDSTCINFKYVENVCGIPSSIDYLFSLYSNQRESSGCCILSCQGIHWEIKRNLNMTTKVGDRIFLKVMRSCGKGMKELTFANSGKKILIHDTSGVKFNEDALRAHYVPDEVVESEINEIPEPDIQVYDSTSGHYVGNSMKAQPEENSDLAHPAEDLTHTNLASANHSHTSPDTTKREISYQEEVFTRGMQSTSSIMPAPMPRSLMELSWYCLNLDKSFDKIIIDKPNFSATYTQMVYALKISREKNIAVRISCAGGSNYMFNNQIWRQGVYADYTLSDIAVKVGPYYNYEVPDIRAFVKVNGILCRTYVQLSREPLTLGCMPRVSKKEKRAVDGKLCETSSACEPTLKENIEKKEGEANGLEDITSTGNESPNVTLAVTSSSTPIALRTAKSELSENMHACSQPSDISLSNFSIKIESVRGNWSGFDDIVNPSCVNLNNTKEKVVASKSIDSTQVHVVNPSCVNLSNTKDKVVASKSIDSTQVHVVNPSCVNLSNTKDKVVASKSIDSTQVHVVNPSCVNLSNPKDKVVASKSIDSTQVHVVNPSSDNTIDTNGKVVDGTQSVASTKVHVCNEKSGFLVPEIPDLMAVCVTKGGRSPKDSKSITMVDRSWNIKGNPLTFKSEEAASDYLASITKVKLYPDDYRVKWIFVENNKYIKMNRGKKLHDIRKLAEDQFITSKGVFSYDDVCTDNLTQYGLKVVDNRRLLEFRRRRDIRAAKYELMSLLPDPKTDVLVKVIYRSWSLIRSLEEKGKTLLDTLIAENARKGFLLSKLRKMCSGEAMYQIFEQLEKISRPRVDTSLDYESAFQKPYPKKRKPPPPRKTPARKRRKGKRSATPRKKISIDSAPTPPVIAEETQKTIKVLKPVKAVAPASPVERLCVPQHGHNTDVSSAKSVKDTPRARSLFSGRYVSAATKRSLRKYNYIIPCLARKHNSMLKKSISIGEESKTPAIGTDYQVVPFPNTFQKVIYGNEDEASEDKTEEIPDTTESYEDLDQSTNAGTSSYVITRECVVDEQNIEESSQVKELVTSNITVEENSLKSKESFVIDVKQEILEDIDECNVGDLLAYENFPSEESFIDVGSKDDLQPITASGEVMF